MSASYTTSRAHRATEARATLRVDNLVRHAVSGAGSESSLRHLGEAFMTPEEIRTELKRLAPWFHRIDLGGGLYTKTESVMGEPVDHPRGPWQTIQRLLPRDLRGHTLLDVGCNAGFYAFEARRRGATRVLGVDGQRHHVRQGVFVRKVLGLDVEFRRLNVYELSP